MGHVVTGYGKIGRSYADNWLSTHDPLLLRPKERHYPFRRMLPARLYALRGQSVAHQTHASQP